MSKCPCLPVIERKGSFGGAEVKQALDHNRPLVTDEDGEWFVLHWKETYWGRGEATLRLMIPAGGISEQKLDRLNAIYGVR